MVDPSTQVQAGIHYSAQIHLVVEARIHMVVLVVFRTDPCLHTIRLPCNMGTTTMAKTEANVHVHVPVHTVVHKEEIHYLHTAVTQ